MNTIQNAADKIRNDAGKAVNDATAKAARLSAVAAAWPEGVPCSTVFDIGSLIAVSHEVDTREEALAWLESFPLAPLTYMRAGYVSLNVKAWQSESKLERVQHEISEIFPMYWTIEGPDMPSQNVHMTAYAEIGGQHVWLKVKIKNDPARAQVSEHRHDRTRRVISRTYAVTGAPGGEIIRYAGGRTDRPGQTSVYFYREPGNGPKPADYLAQSQPISRGNYPA